MKNTDKFDNLYMLGVKAMEERLCELEKRIEKLELENKKMKRNKIITSIVTIVFIIAIALIYIFVISKIFNNYTNIF